MDEFIQTAFGYVYVSTDPNDFNIYGLFVNPEHRRQGKAKQLLMLAIWYLRDIGFEGDIEIEVAPYGDGTAPEDKLKNLYESLGLKIVKRREMVKRSVSSKSKGYCNELR